MNPQENMSAKMEISSEEDVSRILSKEWFVRGKLVSAAFSLEEGETYLSVNRPAIDSYDSDVTTFVKSHTSYVFDGNTYKRALLNVGDIRGIDVKVDNVEMKIDVEVEPRNVHTKSHAGIFTRFQNKNIKKGQLLKAGPTAEEISGDTILLEVRKELKDLSSVEKCKIIE